MGHTALDFVCPDTNFNRAVSQFTPPWDQAERQSVSSDLAIITAAEKLPPNSWENLECTTALWFTDATGRPDQDYSPRYEQCCRMTPYTFFPAPQDAKRFNSTWLPFGIDPAVFHPVNNRNPKYAAAFVGHLYGMRLPYIQRFRAAGINIATPQTPARAWVRNSYEARLRALSLAALYRDCAVIVNLPALCEVYGTRVTEALACGVPLINPTFPNHAEENRATFAYPPPEYDPERPETLAALLADTATLNYNAAFSTSEVLTHHTLQKKLQVILDHCFPPDPLPQTGTQA
jgi:hypothetical protein